MSRWHADLCPRGGVFFLSLSLLLLLFCPSALADTPPHPALIVVLCDALSLDDLENSELPYLRKMAQEGSFALLNATTFAQKTPASTWATLAKGVSSPAISNDFEGTIGQAIRVQNKRAYGYGNADTDTPQRPASLFGQTSQTPTPRQTSKAPFGIIDDPLALYLATFSRDSAMVFLQLGDSSRLESKRNSLSNTEYTAFRQAALLRLNVLLYALMEQIQSDMLSTKILLVSSYPAGEPLSYTEYWQRLTLVTLWGKGVEPGLITSPTTRTVGLLANVDIAPSILSLLNAKPLPTMEGRPFRSDTTLTDYSARFALLARKDYLTTLNFQALITLTAPIFFLCAGGIGFGLALMRRNPKRKTLFQLSLLTLLSAPLALMLAPLLPPPTLLEYGLRILGWMLGLAVGAWGFSRIFKVNPLLTTLAVNLIGIGIDLLTGQHLQKESAVTNSALVGVRYYGIGNEYLGIVFGFALVGGFAWLAGRRETTNSLYAGVLALFWGITALLLAHPKYGANAGSLIMSVVGFGTGLLTLQKQKKPSWRVVALLVVLGVGSTFLLGALEARWSSHEVSHLGATFKAATEARGIGYWGEIITRKVRLNLLTLFSRWYFLCIVGLGLTFWAVWRIQRENLIRLWEASPLLRLSTVPLLATALSALLFKDTGVMTLLFMGSSACFILLWYSASTSPSGEQ